MSEGFLPCRVTDDHPGRASHGDALSASSGLTLAAAE